MAGNSGSLDMLLEQGKNLSPDDLQLLKDLIEEWKAANSVWHQMLAPLAEQAKAIIRDLNTTRTERDQYLAELKWLDKNCSFVADAKYNLGPFQVGELRKLAQAGIAADEAGLATTVECVSTHNVSSVGLDNKV